MPLFALESTINIAIHKLLACSTLANLVDIVYAFPNSNVAGFTLTLPASSRYPGGLLNFQVTSLSGYVGSEHYSTQRVIVVEVPDSSLAQILGIAANKANLVYNENHFISGPDIRGESYSNLAFFQKLSYIMPAYSAKAWIRNLLQVATAIDQRLPSTADDSMDVNPKESISEEDSDRNVDQSRCEYLRRTAPTVFGHLPTYNTKVNPQSLLHHVPLLPGVVVNQILFPSPKSLLQLIMMNQLVQFYRLNKLYQKTMLVKLLKDNSNVCYQETLIHLFKYITFNQNYAIQAPGSTESFKLTISFGAANSGFHGCYLVVGNDGYNQRFTAGILAKDHKARKKMEALFGSKRDFEFYDPALYLAALHAQQLLAVPLLIPPIDFISLIARLVAVDEKEYMYANHFDNDCWPEEAKLEVSFDASTADPSCDVKNLKACKENGESLTAILVNALNRDSLSHFFAVIQVLCSSDSMLHFIHIRFGYKPALFSQQNNVTDLHFTATTSLEFSKCSELYNYWISRLTKPEIQPSQIPTDQRYCYSLVKSSFVFMKIPWEQAKALAYEIWHSQSLKDTLSSIKRQLKNTKDEAFAKLKELEIVLPGNTQVKCCKARMLAKSDRLYEAVRYLKSQLQSSPFNIHLWLTKARILQNANHMKEALQCYVHVCDFPFVDSENACLHKAYQRLFKLCKQLKMWFEAYQILLIFSNNPNVLKETKKYKAIEEKTLLKLAEEWIRQSNPSKVLLDSGLDLLARLPESQKVELLVLEGCFRLDPDNSQDILLALLDNILVIEEQFHPMVLKAVMLHELQHFDEAIECYEKASTLHDRDISFNIGTSIEAAKNNQRIPWPFTSAPPAVDHVWTNEEIMMLFVLHPNAVLSAKKKPLKNQAQHDAIHHLLHEIEAAEQLMENQQKCYATLYPTQYLFGKFFGNSSLRFVNSSSEVSMEVLAGLSEFVDDNASWNSSCLPFLWEWQPYKYENTTLVWYPTHPCAVPFLLMNGIPFEDHGVTFYKNLVSTELFSESKDSVCWYGVEHNWHRENCFSMALLVEVASSVVDQSTAAEKKSPFHMLCQSSSPVLVKDKVHIGRICYIAVVTLNSWEDKVYLISGDYKIFPPR